MENTNQKPVATLKAEFVNEFEFKPRRERVRRLSDETKIVHPYQSDYTATVAVKIGNAIKELVFREHDHYVSSFTREDGTHVSGESFKWLGLKSGDNPFLELETAGIAVDYFHILMQYQEMVKEAKYRETLIERYKKWENIRESKEKLVKSWIHKFENTIKADPNKKIKEALKLTTFAPSTKIEEKHHVDVTYKNVTVPLHKIDGSFCFNNEQYGWESYFNVVITNEAGEKRNIKIAEDRLRRAKREGTLFLKAIEAIDLYLSNIAYKKNERKKQLSNVEEQRTHLATVLGCPICVTEERKYSRNRRDNYNWLEQNYFLLLEQPKDSYESGKRINVSYNDHYKTYSVKGLNNLREDQFKSIVEILRDGRKVLKKLIIPTK